MEAVDTKHLEDRPNMLQVLHPRVAIYQNIIKKHEHALTKEWLQHRVHQALKCGGGIGEAEWHHEELEMPVMGAEGRLGDVVRMYSHLVIAGAEI